MNIVKKVLGNTTLAIVVLTIMALGGAGYAAGATYGFNWIKVDKCVDLANGVNITRFGRSYDLINGCKDAGHGERDYTYNCQYTGGYGYGYNPNSVLTTYSVNWQPCGYKYGYAN